MTTVSFEEFMLEVRRSVPQETAKVNVRVEKTNLPEILYYGSGAKTASRFETGLNLGAETGRLREMVEHKEARETLLGSISDLRGQNVVVTGVQKGEWKKGREFYLTAQSEETGMDVEQIRLLLGVPERKGEDLFSDGASMAFSEELGLPVYRLKVPVREAHVKSRKVA